MRQAIQLRRQGEALRALQASKRVQPTRIIHRKSTFPQTVPRHQHLLFDDCQATDGDAPLGESAPRSLFGSWKADRLEAWKRQASRSRAEARWAYIGFVQECSPSFKPGETASDTAAAAAATAEAARVQGQVRRV